MIENWIRMPSNEKPCDIIKQACRGVFDKIQSGEAPTEFISLYESMKPENFGFWLHGFFSGYSKKIEIRSTEAVRFLRKVLQDYENV